MTEQDPTGQDTGEQRRYEVVRNDEDQYSVYPEGRELPAGWTAVGRAGTEDECVAYIEEVWTDMTPRSVRLRLAAERAADPV